MFFWYPKYLERLISCDRQEPQIRRRVREQRLPQGVDLLVSILFSLSIFLKDNQISSSILFKSSCASCFGFEVKIQVYINNNLRLLLLPCPHFKGSLWIRTPAKWEVIFIIICFVVLNIWFCMKLEFVWSNLALLCFCHISHFGFLMRHSWQMQRSKWAKQVDRVRLLSGCNPARKSEWALTQPFSKVVV